MLHQFGALKADQTDRVTVGLRPNEEFCWRPQKDNAERICIYIYSCNAMIDFDRAALGLVPVVSTSLDETNRAGISRNIGGGFIYFALRRAFWAE